MLISHKCANILIPNFPCLLNTHFFIIDVFFIYLLHTLLSSEETKSVFDFRYSTSAQHDQQRTYPRRWEQMFKILQELNQLLILRDNEHLINSVFEISNPSPKFTSDCSISQAKLLQSLDPHSIFLWYFPHNQILPLRHAVMLSNSIKEIMPTGPERYFFSERVINIWNQLPVLTDFRSIWLFMHSVRGMDLSCYLHIQF